MKNLFITMMAFALVLTPFMAYTQSDQNSTETPPVAQPLVSEGDFAMKLVTALNLGTATTEVQAEDMLISVGIAPKNGWIADYPMTPIIIGEVQSAVVAAAAAKKLPVGENDALKAFQSVTTGFGLAVVPGSGQYAESQPPTSSEYVQPSVVNNYYYAEGPPVVTYYSPPWDYYYLYDWVPYPFWFSGFFFPGFFILNDFDVIAVGHHHHHDHLRITNHFVDPKTNTTFRVDPTTRTIGRAVNVSSPGVRAFNSTEARGGAVSIFERSRPGQTATVNPTYQGPSRVQIPANREQGRPSTVEQGTIGSGSRNRNETRSFGAPSRSFATPRSFSAPRSFSTPSFGGRGSFEGSRGGSFGGFHSGGFAGLHGGGGRRS